MLEFRWRIYAGSTTARINCFTAGKQKYGDIDVSVAKKRLRELERESVELKKMMAKQSPDIRMRKDVNSLKR